ncbi:MAG: threonine aldolase family protein [Bacteroidota bacterium]
MESNLLKNNRRDFLKKVGLSSLPFLIPGVSYSEAISEVRKKAEKKSINLIYDGLFLEPEEYIKKLSEINEQNSIAPDIYGHGGTTKKLEEKLAEMTGKEKAIYLPTGTMANQLAIKLLNGDNTKVIVPENSHVYRDEADAAQSVHGKRLVPIQNGKAYFTSTDINKTIQDIQGNEVFKSGIGTVVIENPVRRANGTAIPIENIHEIAEYCKKNGYKMHLDAARIHLAEAFHGTSLKDYAEPFDTVYISLYKYLNANGGAVLCGDAALIDSLNHQIKIYGGTMYQSWMNTAVALHYLDNISDRFKRVANSSKKIVNRLNQLDGLQISSIPNGTNIYKLNLDSSINGRKFIDYLDSKHQIWLNSPDENGTIRLAFNESILFRSENEMVKAFQNAISA